MNKEQFEELLEKVCEQLSKEAKISDRHYKPSVFEKRVRAVMSDQLSEEGDEVAPDIDQGFPDIRGGRRISDQRLRWIDL